MVQEKRGALFYTYDELHNPDLTIDVAAFDGTNALKEWLICTTEKALHFKPVQDITPKASALEGGVNANFWVNYIRSGFKPALLPNKYTVFTGHSRGGAIANIGTFHLRMERGSFENIGIISYGEPCAFSSDVTAMMDAQLGTRSYRYGFAKDGYTAYYTAPQLPC